MSKQLLVGALAGLIFGVLSMFAFERNISVIILPLILGALIGFLTGKGVLGNLGLYGAAAAIGALFYIPIAMQSGLWLDDIATGAITGLLIGLLTNVSKKFIK